MNLENQQRVVGVVILVAFIALLIPFLFTSGVKTKQQAIDDSNEILPGEVVTNDIPIAKDEFVKPLEHTAGNEIVSHNSPSDTVTYAANPIDNSNIEHTNNPSILTAHDTTTQNIGAVENHMEKSPSSVTPAAVTARAKPMPVIVKNVTQTFKNKVDKQNKILWSVQVGSFAEESRAKQMVAQLQAKNFRVYMQKITTSQGAMVRVLVGRKASKPEAMKLVQRLQKELGVTGYVVGGNK